MSAFLLYNLVLVLTSPLIALYLMQRYLSGKSKPGWRERWGHLPPAFHSKQGGRPRIWMHAVSAGEVVAAVPILRELRSRLPEYDFYFSVITPAGYEMAEQQAKPYVEGIFYSPFDFAWVVQRVVRALRPALFVSLESEIWFNLLHTLRRNGVHTVMVNGRISEKSLRRSQKARFFFRWAISNLDLMLMQSAGDLGRICALGGLSPTDTGRVRVLGNSKFDQAVQRLTAEQVVTLKESLKLPPDAPVWVAGSTRSSEEEAVIFSAYNALLKEFPDLCLVVAPRQIARGAEASDAMLHAGLSPVRRTQLDTSPASVRHLILDTMGELANVYAVATFAFVGNSFPPVVKGGGQNLLQPLAHGKPVLFGPQHATIRSEAQMVTEAGVGFCVQNGEELFERARNLLNDPTTCEAIGQRALELMEAQRGVSARYAEQVVELLTGRSASI